MAITLLTPLIPTTSERVRSQIKTKLKNGKFGGLSSILSKNLNHFKLSSKN